MAAGPEGACRGCGGGRLDGGGRETFRDRAAVPDSSPQNFVVLSFGLAQLRPLGEGTTTFLPEGFESLRRRHHTQHGDHDLRSQGALG